jgi:4a-hydroxytetrahydrobiopterin dehydratase
MPRASKTKAKTAKPRARPARRAATRGPTRARAPFPLPAGWSLDKGGKSISLRVTTKDFLAAVALINRIAPIAEDLEHHPDLHLEQWNKLRITSYSHDEGKLTDRDERLAQAITELLAKEGQEPDTTPPMYG